MKKRKTGAQTAEDTGRPCPRCGFLTDRPHAAVCVRCNGELPGAAGCTGCGSCTGGV